MELYVYKDDNGNEVIGNLYLDNSRIKFNGNNNKLIINKEIKLENSSLEFRGDNSIIYLCSTDDKLPLDIKVYNNSVVYFGYDTWINKGIKIVAS